MGFDPISRRWVTGSDARASVIHVPPLKGRLLFSEAALSADADDFGHIVHNDPWAVLQPGDINDIVVMLRFCNEQGILAAPRGQGHATYGQAQVSGGLVIETATLDAIRVGADSVEVEAGARWSSVLGATLPHGLTPPVLTDYLELSVGGTLSAGGVGGASPHYGAQVDNVLELEVVTGAGQRVVCSPERAPDLFHAVLAGLGQCAVLVRATLRLVPAPSQRAALHPVLPLGRGAHRRPAAGAGGRPVLVRRGRGAAQSERARLAVLPGGGRLLRLDAAG